MKKKLKLIGIIALVAVIGFTIASCSNGTTGSGRRGGNGSNSGNNGNTGNSGNSGNSDNSGNTGNTGNNGNSGNGGSSGTGGTEGTGGGSTGGTGGTGTGGTGGNGGTGGDNSGTDTPGGNGTPDDTDPFAITSPNVGKLVYIPAGTFMMGSPTNEPDRNSWERRHSVTLTQDFYMGEYQVTQEQYQVVMGTNPSYFHGNGTSLFGVNLEPAAGEVQGKRPVERVRWYDAIVFCNKLSMKEGLTPAYKINDKTDPAEWGAAPTGWNGVGSSPWDTVVIVDGSTGYRLPTDAQWEYACRAGTNTAYYTGDTVTDDTGWYNGNSDGRTHEVGKKPANPWGLYDMAGNVSEWCWDWFEGDLGTTEKTDPTESAFIATRLTRVKRGGSYLLDGGNLRSAHRSFDSPGYGVESYGFRLVRPAQ